MARPPFFNIPTQVLEDQQRAGAADDWAQTQRSQVADDWAAMHTQDYLSAANEITQQAPAMPRATPGPGPFSNPTQDAQLPDASDPGSPDSAGGFATNAPQDAAGGGLLDTARTAGDLGKFSLPDAQEQPPPDQGGARPDVPELPAPTLIRGPMGGPVGMGMLPGQPGKPAPPSDQDAAAIAQGQAPIKGADELIGRAAGFLGQQGASRPASLLMAAGGEGAKVPEGSAGGAGETGLAQAAGDAAAGGGDVLQSAGKTDERARALLDSPVGQEVSSGEPKRSVWTQFWKRSRDVIGDQGPAGQQLAQKLQDWRSVSEQMAGRWYSEMPTVRSLDKGEFTNFVDVAEGKAQPVNADVAKAAEEWKAVHTQVYQQAQDAGVDVAGQIENYFPHTFEPGRFTGNGWTDAVRHLVESGQAKDETEAAGILRYAQDVRRNRRYGNLEAERVANLPGYRRSPDVIPLHLQAAAERIAQVQTFGQKDEQALSLINQIGSQGYDAGAAKSLFDISVGATRYGDIQQSMSRGLRAFNTVTKLGLSALSNAGQTVNTATVAGVGNTVKALPATLSADGREYALRLGVTLPGVIQDVREQTGVVGGALGKVTAPGFNAVEQFNRTLAVHAGLAYADQVAEAAASGDRAATGALTKLGLDARGVIGRGGQLTEDEQATAARSLVERTQFKVDPQDLPGWASSPWGKVVAQFRSFSYNQSAFLNREIVQPALQGDVRPLLRFAVAGLLAGGGIQEARNVVQNRPSEEDPTKRLIQYYNAIGAGGLARDLVTGLIPIGGKQLPVDRQTTLAISTLLGPTFGDAAEAYSSLVQAAHGNFAPIERTALRHAPIVGTTLQNTLVPYKGSDTGPAAGPSRSSGATSVPRPPAAPRPPALRR